MAKKIKDIKEKLPEELGPENDTKEKENEDENSSESVSEQLNLDRIIAIKLIGDYYELLGDFYQTGSKTIFNDTFAIRRALKQIINNSLNRD